MITELELNQKTQDLISKFYLNGQQGWDAGEVALSQVTRARQILTGGEIGNMNTAKALLDANDSIAWALLKGLGYLGKIEFSNNGGGWCYRVINKELAKPIR